MFAAVYGRPLIAWTLALASLAPSVQAQPAAGDELIVQAKEAQRTRDRKRLAQLNATAQAQSYALAPWIDYWELGLRLAEVSQPELDAFYARWPGSYVEDRLRNDWLLELGKRRDWKNFSKDYAAYKMRDDREVLCYWLLTEHQAGRKVTEEARAAWLAQKDGDDGCQLLASTLFDAKKLDAGDVWLRLRLAVEAQRPRAVKQAAALLGRPVEQALVEIQDKAGKYLERKAKTSNRTQSELTTLALVRVAAVDADQVASLMKKKWERQLPAELAAWVWAQAGRQAAFKLQPEANEYFERALKLHPGKHGAPEWGDDTVAWAARAALRAEQWPQLLTAIKLLGFKEQNQPGWQYWRARALLASGANEAQRSEGRTQMQALVSPLSYYGHLAAEELGQHKLALPAAPAPLTPAERAQAQANPGISRALQLIALNLRFDGVREWNFSMRGLSDRELMAAAREACDREVWDRCISASERARSEVDLNLRFPAPLRREVLAKTREVGVDPAYVYGLIRQESRFVHDARSHVGASGLMQLMPATAKWTAKKVGMPYAPELLHDREFNIKLGASYLKLVLDGFEGSEPLAAAAYNAGPGRPRRWREGPAMDAAAWVENIPFYETRDYVKNVILNATIYEQLLNGNVIGLRARLGREIGPKPASAGVSDIPTP